MDLGHMAYFPRGQDVIRMNTHLVVESLSDLGCHTDCEPEGWTCKKKIEWN